MSEQIKPEFIEDDNHQFDKEAERKRLMDKLCRALDDEAEVARLSTVEARYRDLLNRLGVQGHDGAIAEIDALRRRAGLTPNRE